MQQYIQNLINSPISNTAVNSVSETIIKLLLAMILGVIVASVYKHVHRGISYSQSFAYSIVVVAMVVAFVMIIIGSDIARAFTLLGAFTLIRYRTAVKDPKDTSFIFLALVVGLGVGASDYAAVIAGTLVISAIALMLNKFNFGSLIKLEQVLYLTVDVGTVDQASLEVILKGLFKEIALINVNYNSSNNSLQYSYNVKIKQQNNQASAMKHISDVEGIVNAEILSSQQVIEF